LGVVWHAAQALPFFPAPPWPIGNECAKLASHVLVVWQRAQSVPKNPLWNFGSAWQETQVCGVPLKV